MKLSLSPKLEMGEITETTNSSSSSNKQGEVEITVKTIGPFRPSLLQVSACIKVCDLRKLIASNGRGSVENLKLILRGRVLNGDVYVQLNQGDTVMVAAKPRPPAKHVPDGLDEDNSDDYVRFRLPPTASKWKRELFSFLHKKLKIPDILLMAIFSLRLKVWAIIITWFMLAPIAHRWDLGPVYILGTGFAIIFFNLGQRQAGDVSAYSIFNDDFRELPGTLNADRLDRDIRAGQF